MKKRINALFLASMTLLSAAASAANLHLKTFNPGAEAIFPVTSTLIYGDHDAVLVDAQFQKKYAKQVVDTVKQSGKNLKYVFISHNDPDYYFGLDEIKKAFPQAQVISTAQTAYLISASKDEKMTVWKDNLGADAPAKLYVPDAITSPQITIDGQVIDIRQAPNDTAHSYLWIPSLKTVLGGTPVSTGEHLWMADTSSINAIDLWLARIKDMQSLQPQRVIPGHYLKEDTSPAALAFIKAYLTDYKNAVMAHKDAAGIVAAMEAKYPALPGRESLEFGAKVFTGEAPWQVTSPFPPIGKTAEVKFNDAVFDLHFRDNRTLSLAGIAGPTKGIKDTVPYTATEVARNVFMVYWQEPNAGPRVVHVQDWNTNTVYSNVAGKEGSFVHQKGTINIK